MHPMNIDPKLEGLCPFLGFCDDRDTALSYPSQYNCCYKAKPVISVSMVHQRRYCLGKDYITCPVIKAESIAPLPQEIAGKFPRPGRMKIWIALLGVIGILLIGSIVMGLIGAVNIPGIPILMARVTRTQTPNSWVMPSATITISQPVETLTEIALPTNTDTPIVPTVTAPHFLETPIGTDPVLVLHNVVEGESFFLLANNHNTSPGAIQAINFEMENTLYADQVIAIPVNTTEVSALPAFDVFEVTDDHLLIETVAMGLNVDIIELCKYNHLSEGYVLTKGEWLLIPR
jgi:hypothetical protein